MGAERSEGSGETRAFADEEGAAFITNPPRSAPGSPRCPACPHSSLRARLLPRRVEGSPAASRAPGGPADCTVVPQPGCGTKARGGAAAADQERAASEAVPRSS